MEKNKLLAIRATMPLLGEMSFLGGKTISSVIQEPRLFQEP